MTSTARDTARPEYASLIEVMLDLVGSLDWNVALYLSRQSEDVTIEAWHDTTSERVRIEADSAYLAVVELARVVAPELLEG